MPKHTSEVAIKNKQGGGRGSGKKMSGFSEVNRRTMFSSSRTMGSRLLGMNGGGGGIDIQEIENEDEESDESLNRAEL